MPATHEIGNHGPADPTRPPLVITFRLNDDGSTVTEATMNGVGPDYVLMQVARLNYELALAKFGDPCEDPSVAAQMLPGAHKAIHVLRDWSQATQEYWEYISTPDGDD